MQDVAYVLTTSLDSDLLSTAFEPLVDFYTEALTAELRERGIQVDGDALRGDFDVVWLDYARVIITGLWKNLSRERMEQYRNTVGPSMINRSMDHVIFIVKRMHRLLFAEQSVYKRLNQVQQ